MKINRTRIVNLNYNDGKRTIYNECFDYRGGKNTLFSMDNGLGKTVIIQFMLQPFLRRNRDLAKRDFSSYFKGTNPVYIMHELLLDDGSNLLIGTLLKGDKTSEQKNRVKVIAFTHKYNSENEFDIYHMQFVTQNASGNNKIITFNEAETLLRNQSRLNSNLVVYNFDDNLQKKKYFDYLERNGVNYKEWETLIKKINQQESGLSELFSTCETTPKLLKEQIIPIIDEKLRVTDDRIQSLISHAKKYISTYMDHQQEIQKSISYKSFLNDIAEIDDSFNICETNIDNINSINLFLKQLFLSINYQIDNKENNDNDFVKIIAQKEKEIKNVKYQQVSYNAYIQKEQIDDILDEISENKVKIEEIDADIREYVKNKSIQECAKHYERLVQKKASLTALKETLRNNELNEADIIEKINNYKFTLKNIYQDMIKDLDIQIKNINESVSEKQNSKNKTTNILNELKTLNITFNEKSAKNNIIIKNYTDKETLISSQNEVFKKMIEENVSENKRNIINNFIEYILNTEEQLNTQKRDLETNISSMKESLNAYQSQLDNFKEKNIQLSNDIYKKQLELDEILKTELVLNEILKKYDFNEVSEKTLKDVLKYINNELNKYVNLQKTYLQSMNYYEHLLQNAKNNKYVDIDDDLLNYLSENNIQYMFGFDWIKTQIDTKDEQISLLRKNPLIPYSLIITDKDIDKLSNLDLPNHDLLNIPVFTPSTVSNLNLNVLSNNTYMINQIYYLTSLNFDLLDINKYENYIKSIKEKIDDLTKKLEIANADVKILNADKSKLENTSYSENAKKNIELNLEELKNTNRNNTESINKLSHDIVGLQESIEANQIIISNNEKELNKLFILRNYCSELLSLADDYDFAKIEETEISIKYDNNKKEINTLSNSLNKMDEFITSKNLEILELSNKKNIISKKHDTLKDINGIEVDEEKTVDELEKTIESLESKLSKDVFAIKQDIKNIEDDINYIQNDICRIEKKNNLSVDDYQHVSYNEALFDNYDELIYSRESDKEDIEDVINDLDRDRVVYESKYEDILDELTELGFSKPLPYQDINIRNFDTVISNLEDELNELEKNNSESLRLYESFTSCLSKIKRYIKNFEFKQDENIEVIKDSIILKEAINNLDEKLLSISEYKDALNKQENKIRQKLNNTSRKYVEISEQMNLILEDNDILSVKEKLSIFKDSLNDLLKYLDLTTQNIHDEEMFVINEAIEYACSVYSEIIQIDKQSKVLVNGKNKQMLQIKLPLEEALNKENVEYFVRNTINDIVENYNNVDVDKILSNQLKSINLFDKLINGLNSVKIYIYKIEKHSLIRKEWKEINSENSGGEQFVSVFILFVSLLSYMRNDDENVNTGKVLIMDNPFAKTNAEHLLVPMFDIAKKFNVQLICFSGIGGSSVYNRFDVIYASKIIKDKYRDSEILEFNNNEEIAETVELLGISIEKDKATEIHSYESADI